MLSSQPTTNTKVCTASARDPCRIYLLIMSSSNLTTCLSHDIKITSSLTNTKRAKSTAYWNNKPCRSEQFPYRWPSLQTLQVSRHMLGKSHAWSPLPYLEPSTSLSCCTLHCKTTVNMNVNWVCNISPKNMPSLVVVDNIHTLE